MFSLCGLTVLCLRCQQLDSGIHIHIDILFFRILFPWGLLECCTVSLAIQEVLFDPLYYVSESVSTNPNLLIHPSHPYLACGNHVCFETLWVSLCYINEFISVRFWIPTVSDIKGYLSFSVRVTSLSMIMSGSIQMPAIGIISSFLMVVQSLGRVRPLWLYGFQHTRLRGPSPSLLSYGWIVLHCVHVPHHFLFI